MCESPIAPLVCNGQSVYVGADGQLWRWDAERGQVTVAGSDGAADWVQRYAPREVELIARMRMRGVVR